MAESASWIWVITFNFRCNLMIGACASMWSDLFCHQQLYWYLHISRYIGSVKRTRCWMASAEVLRSLSTGFSKPDGLESAKGITGEVETDCRRWWSEDGRAVWFWPFAARGACWESGIYFTASQGQGQTKRTAFNNDLWDIILSDELATWKDLERCSL